MDQSEPADWLARDIQTGPGRSLQAPLFRAMGVKRGQPFRPVILDGTGGQGLDAWLLAACGCRVIVVERHPDVFARLAASHHAAQKKYGDITGRIRLIHADTLHVLRDPSQFFPEAVDAVYLDPMFPAGRKTAEKKALRELRACVGDDPDADELLTPARKLARKRVTVKRPARAPALHACEPDLVYRGKGFRFDVYLKVSSAIAMSQSE